MRIGLLGLGRIGAFHAETLAGLPAVDSLVVSDPVPGRARDAAERFGAHVAGTPEALLASGVDGVVIAAATGAHPELLLLCVTAGVPTFCEKPVAPAAAEDALEASWIAEACSLSLHEHRPVRIEEARP